MKSLSHFTTPLLPFAAAGALFASTASYAAPGDIDTYVGTGNGATTTNVPAVEAVIRPPHFMAIDSDGNLYFSTTNSPINRVDASTGILSEYAFLSTPGDAGDEGPALLANAQSPQEIALDRDGNLYVCDSGAHRIRRIDAVTKTVTTVAGDGTSGFSGDGGPATSAKLNGPVSIAVDYDGNIYFCDSLQTRIRKIDSATGFISTIAGDGTGDFAGDDGPAVNAKLHGIRGLCIDLDGNLIISDRQNHRIRKIDFSDNTIRTIVGNGFNGPIKESVDALSARLYFPSGVAIDGDGNLFIGDYAHDCIRRVDAVTNLVNDSSGNNG
ncbi:MAG: hypothetical protein AAGC68_09695 [Verrucomicrobiota bacterium]